MTYLMSDLVEATGVTPRTIRKYIKDGFLPPPDGLGLAATYSETHLVKAQALARMRLAGENWTTIGARLRNWPLKRLRAYLEETAPEPEPPVSPPADAVPPDAQAPSDPAPPPALEGQPAADQRRLPGGDARPGDPLAASASLDDAWLPDGPRWVPVSLLPGLALWVRDDAALLVRRTAAEIVRLYGSR